MTQNTKIVIGIDFGTTQTTACFIDSQTQKIELIHDETNSPQYASMLSFQQGKYNNLCQFGNSVKNNAFAKLVIQEAKRFIGEEYSDELAEMAEKLGMNIECGDNGECVFVINDENDEENELRFTAEELVSIQLKYIKDIILKRCSNANFSRVVMTVPSSFNIVRINAMKYAFELAGIQPYTIMKEPTAALYEYKSIEPNRKMKKAFVVDIGGGTTDVCICEPNGTTMNVKRHEGDPFLGGSDFDRIIQDIILQQLEDNGYENMNLFVRKGTETKKQTNERIKYTHRLKQEAERIKIELSEKNFSQVNFEKLLPLNDPFDNSITISRGDFEEKIRESGLLEKLEECIDECLSKANTRVKTIDTVILVGGVTYMPIIRKLIENKFGQQKIVVDSNYKPLLAVAKGAARYANNYNLAASSSNDLVEFVPESIGVEIEGNRMHPIAKKGDPTPIPHFEETFTTSRENQTSIEFVLKKGESPFPMDNEYITEYQITIPQAPIGKIRVTLHIDIEKSGNMVVKAIQHGSNQQGVEKRVSCGFNQTDENFKESLDKIKPYCPQ